MPDNLATVDELKVLDSHHMVYRRNAATWLRQENRLRGGQAVMNELTPFDWERAAMPRALIGGDSGSELALQIEVEQMLRISTYLNEQPHYIQRQSQATYLNFADMYATVIAGHLLRASPRPGQGLSFGALGEVRPLRDMTGTPTQAELVYYNADGTGTDGAQWDNFWAAAAKRAIATGHRWIYADAPDAYAGNRQDEINGLRPFLVEFSPVQVTNWHYSNGSLQFAIVRVPSDEPELSAEDDPLGIVDDYLVLVATGCAKIGARFAAGGWWRFNNEKELVAEGDWSKTEGKIPMVPLYHERDKGSRGWPMMSRSGTIELSQCAVSYMNLASAADFDAWDAAMSIEFLQGVDEVGFNLAMAKLKEGSRYVPLPTNRDTDVTPSVKDGSAGAVVAQVFDLRLASKREEAAQLAAQQITMAPDSSGLSKKAGFGEAKSPRLALMASEMEAAQNAILAFLEMRFGKTARSAAAVWTRDFELLEVMGNIESYFALSRLSGISSPTLSAALMVRAADNKGLFGSDMEREAVAAEFQTAADAKLAYSAAEASLLTETDES